jgi:hypothetical protein
MSRAGHYWCQGIKGPVPTDLTGKVRKGEREQWTQCAGGVGLVVSVETFAQASPATHQRAIA